MSLTQFAGSGFSMSTSQLVGRRLFLFLRVSPKIPHIPYVTGSRTSFPLSFCPPQTMFQQPIYNLVKHASIINGPASPGNASTMDD